MDSGPLRLEEADAPLLPTCPEVDRPVAGAAWASSAAAAAENAKRSERASFPGREVIVLLPDAVRRSSFRP